jgi:hypothetical protein
MAPLAIVLLIGAGGCFFHVGEQPGEDLYVALWP